MGEEAPDASEETALAIKGYRDAMTYVLQLAEEPRFRFEGQLIKSLHFHDDELRPEKPPGPVEAGPIYVQKEETGEIVYEGVDVDSVDALVHELATYLESDGDTPSSSRPRWLTSTSSSSIPSGTETAGWRGASKRWCSPGKESSPRLPASRNT